MEDIFIQVKDVEFEYKVYEEETEYVEKALRGVSIDIRKGEYLVILGHNGSGKSSLAKLLNGLNKPSQGEVFVKGLDTKDEDNTWEIRKNCGMVFQNPDNQLVTTIVEEDVAFGPENLGIPNPELRQRVEDALELVGMTKYRHHAPSLLSGGQKQRIAIAGILAMKPECIVLDEPTAMLDPRGREEIVDTIIKLNKEEGKTIVYITHFMEEAVVADRIIVLNDGLIALEGTPREVFSQVDVMKDLGLDVPQVTELAYELNRSGFDIRSDILTVEELIEEL